MSGADAMGSGADEEPLAARPRRYKGRDLWYRKGGDSDDFLRRHMPELCVKMEELVSKVNEEERAPTSGENQLFESLAQKSMDAENTNPKWIAIVRARMNQYASKDNDKFLDTCREELCTAMRDACELAVATSPDYDKTSEDKKIKQLQFARAVNKLLNSTDEELTDDELDLMDEAEAVFREMGARGVADGSDCMIPLWDEIDRKTTTHSSDRPYHEVPLPCYSNRTAYQRARWQLFADWSSSDKSKVIKRSFEKSRMQSDMSAMPDTSAGDADPSITMCEQSAVLPESMHKLKSEGCVSFLHYQWFADKYGERGPEEMWKAYRATPNQTSKLDIEQKRDEFLHGATELSLVEDAFESVNRPFAFASTTKNCFSQDSHARSLEPRANCLVIMQDIFNAIQADDVDMYRVAIRRSALAAHTITDDDDWLNLIDYQAWLITDPEVFDVDIPTNGTSCPLRKHESSIWIPDQKSIKLSEIFKPPRKIVLGELAIVFNATQLTAWFTGELTLKNVKNQDRLQKQELTKPFCDIFSRMVGQCLFTNHFKTLKDLCSIDGICMEGWTRRRNHISTAGEIKVYYLDERIYLSASLVVALKDTFRYRKWVMEHYTGISSDGSKLVDAFYAIHAWLRVTVGVAPCSSEEWKIVFGIIVLEIMGTVLIGATKMYEGPASRCVYWIMYGWINASAARFTPFSDATSCGDVCFRVRDCVAAAAAHSCFRDYKHSLYSKIMDVLLNALAYRTYGVVQTILHGTYWIEEDGDVSCFLRSKVPDDKATELFHDALDDYLLEHVPVLIQAASKRTSINSHAAISVIEEWKDAALSRQSIRRNQQESVAKAVADTLLMEERREAAAAKKALEDKHLANVKKREVEAQRKQRVDAQMVAANARREAEKVAEANQAFVTQWSTFLTNANKYAVQNWQLYREASEGKQKDVYKKQLWHRLNEWNKLDQMHKTLLEQHSDTMVELSKFKTTYNGFRKTEHDEKEAFKAARRQASVEATVPAGSVELPPSDKQQPAQAAKGIAKKKKARKKLPSDAASSSEARTVSSEVTPPSAPPQPTEQEPTRDELGKYISHRMESTRVSSSIVAPPVKRNAGNAVMLYRVKTCNVNGGSGGIVFTNRLPPREQSPPSTKPECPDDLCCPITLEPMFEARILCCGHTFSKIGLERHIATAERDEKIFACPTCRARFGKESVIINLVVQQRAADYA